MFSKSLPERLEVADAFYHSYARHTSRGESLPSIEPGLIFEGDLTRLPRIHRELITRTQLTDYLINMVGFALNHLKQGTLVSVTPAKLRYGSALKRLPYARAFDRIRDVKVQTYYTPEVTELGLIVTLPEEFAEDVMSSLRDAGFSPQRSDLSSTWIASIL